MAIVKLTKGPETGLAMARSKQRSVDGSKSRVQGIVCVYRKEFLPAKASLYIPYKRTEVTFFRPQVLLASLVRSLYLLGRRDTYHINAVK